MYTQVLTKIPFYQIKAMEFQKLVYSRKDLTLISIYDMIFKKKYTYISNLYINNEKLLFSKFQYKITGKICGLGKI